MNRHCASAISLATATAAIACAAAIASSKAFAETPTIDITPFVSARSRADVRAELMSQSRILNAAGSEWAMQLNHVPRMDSGFTREQARSEYMAAREQVSATTSEDSGSSYFTRQAFRMQPATRVAAVSR